MHIKVCGLKYPDNIKAVELLSPNYMGFICYQKSSRFIDEVDERALTDIPPHIKKTGVFVNEEAHTINTLIDKYHFDAIQLHGNESAELCKLFKGKFEVIKAFGVDDNFDFSILDAYESSVDYFLFDTKTVAHGGSGQTFNWGVLEKYKLSTPFFLSGGLSAENIKEVMQIKHPAFYGVDLNSRFELSPGLKDIDKLKQAFDTIKNYSNEVRS
ncbi:phosphoribosylanthranilate isomerase [Mucilaginibacter litoreus]|uniref:N-(5'-phosphoribosyl)anthranilate isomerase n=1 Tax=Mucilaginibacter litoreus TaxID=1048221 RepID=A0ABW3ASA3_9SPHI